MDKSSPPTCHLLRSTCAEKSPAFSSSSDSSSSRGGPVTFPRGLLLFPPSSVVHKLRGSLRRNARPALKSNLRASSPSVPVPGSLHPASVPGGSPPVVQALPDSPLVPRRSQESAWSTRSATIQLMNPMSGPDRIRTGPDPGGRHWIQLDFHNSVANFGTSHFRMTEANTNPLCKTRAGEARAAPRPSRAGEKRTRATTPRPSRAGEKRTRATTPRSSRAGDKRTRATTPRLSRAGEKRTTCVYVGFRMYVCLPVYVRVFCRRKSSVCMI